MDNLIRQIYGGFDRFPADLMGVDAPEYIEAKDKVHTLYEAFKVKLPLNLAEGLDSLMEAHLEILAEGMEEGFVSGFKIGARLMIEILAESGSAQ